MAQNYTQDANRQQVHVHVLRTTAEGRTIYRYESVVQWV